MPYPGLPPRPPENHHYYEPQVYHHSYSGTTHPPIGMVGPSAPFRPPIRGPEQLLPLPMTTCSPSITEHVSCYIFVLLVCF